MTALKGMTGEQAGRVRLSMADGWLGDVLPEAEPVVPADPAPAVAVGVEGGPGAFAERHGSADGGLGPLAAGGWRLAAGGWRLAAGGWRLAAGGWWCSACLGRYTGPVTFKGGSGEGGGHSRVLPFSAMGWSGIWLVAVRPGETAEQAVNSIVAPWCRFFVEFLNEQLRTGHENRISSGGH
jgi:hypothetical protein